MMVDERLAPYAVFILRVALGGMFLAHSIVLKLMTFGLPATAAFFASLGLPGWLGYVVFVLEALGGFALVLGVQARWVALGLVPILLGAIWRHSEFGWVFDADGGGWEYPLYLTVLCFTQFMLGDGPWAITRSWMPDNRLPRMVGA